MDSPDRWNAIGYRLQALIFAAMGPEPYPLQPAEKTWESLTLFYFADEQSSRAEVDELVRGASRDCLLRSTTSRRAKYYFFLRAQCALDFLGSIHPPLSSASPIGEVPANFSDAQLIEWLLIDLWVRRHDTWMKLTAISLYGPFSFYGIGPSDPRVPQ